VGCKGARPFSLFGSPLLTIAVLVTLSPTVAPEIFLTQYYNLKVDVYSFAIVLHCMLSLVRPFEKYNAHLHSLLVCKEGVRPHIPHEWPGELQDSLRRGWAHNPHDRPSIKEIRQNLELLMRRVERETTPVLAKNSDPLLGGHNRMMPSSTLYSFLKPVQDKAGTLLRAVEHQVVRGNATTYPVRRIVSHQAPPQRKREPAHFRQHLRSTYL
jgi:Protein tyrosine and serine/threonine kinase